MMSNSIIKQRGATLLITLVALIVVTFLALAAIRGGMTNLRIAGNAQTILEAQSLAQSRIDAVIADMDTFKNTPGSYSAATMGVGGTSHSHYSVDMALPRCLDSRPVKGYSEVVTGGSAIGSASISSTTLQQASASAPLEQLWDFAATASDSFSGTSVTVHQGIRVRMSSSTACPN